MKLSIAIVTYHSDLAILQSSVDSVVVAVACARQQWPMLEVDFYLIDNDPAASSSRALASRLAQLTSQGIAYLEIIHSGKNLGYGAGHNACLNAFCKRPLVSDYHLILNPDVILAEDFLLQGLAFLEKEKNVAAIAPYVENEDGTAAYLCKRYPTVLDLFLRGFTPAPVRHCFRQRLDHYQMKDIYDAQQVNTAVPIISGCCMLVRTGIFRELNGFDERFFLYFEDFDLSLRMAAKGKVAYHPALRIRHLGGFSARKGFWHVQQFIRSARQFFAKHGWKWV
jgi:GT2 family glycosyltransferase